MNGGGEASMGPGGQLWWPGSELPADCWVPFSSPSFCSDVLAASAMTSFPSLKALLRSFPSQRRPASSPDSPQGHSEWVPMQIDGQPMALCTAQETPAQTHEEPQVQAPCLPRSTILPV